MDLLNQIRADYQRFPKDQSFHLYADDVYFKDPVNEFRGVKRYQEMIGFMERWFQQVNLELHDIRYGNPQRIDTRWTLSWVAPAPWKPAMSIPGRSELEVNDEGKIALPHRLLGLLKAGGAGAGIWFRDRQILRLQSLKRSIPEYLPVQCQRSGFRPPGDGSHRG
jgi:hypothetical protein